MSARPGIRGIAIFACALALATQTLAQGTTNLSIEQERNKELKEFSIDQIPDPGAVEAFARSILGKPLNQQTDEDLNEVAKQSNIVANLVNMITREYDSYYSERYRYDFVLKKLRGPRDSYTKISNKFLDFRNQAYYNLGLKAKESGKTLRAFLYFRDAFRLSTFDCGPRADPKKCMRWRAEQELQKLLNISSIKAYVSWE